MRGPAGKGGQHSGYVLAGAGGALTSLFVGWLLGERLRPRTAGALSGLVGTLVGRALLRAGPPAAAALVARSGEAGAQNPGEAQGEAQEVPRRGPNGRERSAGAAVHPVSPHPPQPVALAPRSHHL